MTPTLARHIEVFDRRFPELRTQRGADGLCCWASRLFCRQVPGSRMLHLWGSRRHFPLRIDEYPSRDPGYYHVVAEVRGTVFDWSRRQLDPRAEHPFVQPIADLRRDWIRIGPSAEYLGL